MTVEPLPSSSRDDRQAVRSVLMVAYQFPPLTGAGVFRPLKWAKYLGEFGWQPTIVSVVPEVFDAVDPVLCQELPSSVTIHRARQIHPSRIERAILTVWTLLWRVRLRFIARHLEPYMVIRWLAPDVHFTWILPAYRKAMSLIATKKPDVIITTAPPFSAHLVGFLLNRRTGIPWIADYRDPWSQNPFVSYPTRAHYHILKWLDQLIVRTADAVIGTTSRMTQDLQKLIDQPASRRFHTIWNGFDSADFQQQELEDTPHERFTIAHVGALYQLRSAKTFLVAVDSLVNEGCLPEANLSVAFIGKDGSGDVAPYKEKPWLVAIDSVAHDQAIQRMLEADVLLLIVNKEAETQVPGKLFEYMAAHRTILALAPATSETANILRTANTGVLVDPDDFDGIKRTLVNLYEDWLAHGRQLPKPQTEQGQSVFERRQQAYQLATIMSELTRGNEEI